MTFNVYPVKLVDTQRVHCCIPGLSFQNGLCLYAVLIPSRKHLQIWDGNFNSCFPDHLLVFSFSGDGLGEGYGMLGQAGSGKLRVSVGQSKLAAKAEKR